MKFTFPEATSSIMWKTFMIYNKMLWEDHMCLEKFAGDDNSPNRRRVGYQKIA
jgi:hypothetical protein